MQYDSEFVEFIVREVIRRLTAAGTHAVVNPSAAAPKELAVNERLVTLATVQGKLDGITKLSVKRRAVVTPAVRDELTRRQIELHRDR